MSCPSQSDENSDRDGELAEVEGEVTQIQSTIHSLLLTIEQSMGELAELSCDIFPELNIKYPDLCLKSVRVGYAVHEVWCILVFWDTRISTKKVT